MMLRLAPNGTISKDAMAKHQPRQEGADVKRLSLVEVTRARPISTGWSIWTVVLLRPPHFSKWDMQHAPNCLTLPAKELQVS